MRKHAMPDVVVVLPGILGSVLQKDGKDLWGLSAGTAFNLVTGRASLESLLLREDPAEPEDLGDGISATRLFPDVHLVPGLWKIDGYSHITTWLKNTFALDDHANYFEFPYDWRRSNAIAAKTLARLSDGWLQRWREWSGNNNAKLILVCHSMGGLVSRYFLEVLGGWKQTRALVTFGTPYAGSLKALNFLSNGLTKQLGPITLADLSALVRSLTSVYQLLPTYACCDVGGPKPVTLTEADHVANLDATKLAQAFAFHNAITTAVDAHPIETRTTRYASYPIVGIRQETFQSARITDGAVSCSTQGPADTLGGDGTVPRVSAIPRELAKTAQPMYAAAQHSSVQNADAPLTQLHGILTGLTLDLDIFRAVPVELALAMDDVYAADEPVTIRVTPDQPLKTLTATIAETETKEARRIQLNAQTDGTLRAEHPPLPPGIYRVRVSGGSALPIADVFSVV